MSETVSKGVEHNLKRADKQIKGNFNVMNLKKVQTDPTLRTISDNFPNDSELVRTSAGEGANMSDNKLEKLRKGSNELDKT